LGNRKTINAVEGYEIKDGILETDSAEALSLITNAEIEDHP